MASILKKIEYALFPCTHRLESALHEFETAVKQKRAEHGESGRHFKLNFSGRK